MIKTFSPKASQVTRGWQVLDASGQTLGRLATQAAIYLRGKHKPTFTPHMDMGDHVVIVNAERIRVTGKKLQQKVYYRHSGYPGGQKSRTLEQELARFPGRVIERAVRGMLPRNALGEAMSRKLHVYAGPEHPHRGQVLAGEVPVRGARPRPQPEAGAGSARQAKPEQRSASAPGPAAAVTEQEEPTEVAEGTENANDEPAASDEEEKTG